MKKLTLLLVVLFYFIGICRISAQSSQIATLSNGSKVSVYYGVSALKSAHEAAEDGDVITLSSGTFSAVNITKDIVLRGAGMEIDTINNILPTTIVGDFYIRGNYDNRLSNFVMEGICCEYIIRLERLNNPKFIKCRLKYLSETSILDAIFLHCRITDEVNLTNKSSSLFLSSIVEDPVSNDSDTSFEFENCIIYVDRVSFTYVKNSLFKNSIVFSRVEAPINTSCVAYNCVSNDVDMFVNINNSTNKGNVSLANLFKTYTEELSFKSIGDEMFELTDDAKIKYLGVDGTQIGIHGGAMPFDITPTNPQIKKCNVATKSTVDGKLSVDIKVNVEN